MYSHVSLSHSVIPKDVYVVRLNSKVLKDGQGGWIISDFPVRSTLKFIYNCVYINCQYYYLVIKNLSILALKLEHFSFIIIQNYSSEGIWSKFSSFQEWPHPLRHLSNGLITDDRHIMLNIVQYHISLPNITTKLELVTGSNLSVNRG